jgi:hypothetical protein
MCGNNMFGGTRGPTFTVKACFYYYYDGIIKLGKDASPDQAEALKQFNLREYSSKSF